MNRFFEEWEHACTSAPADCKEMLPDPPRGVCWQLVSVVLVDEPVVDSEGNIYSRKFLRAYWKRPVVSSDN